MSVKLHKYYSSLLVTLGASFAMSVSCHAQFTWTGGGNNANWNASRTIFFTTYYTNWNDESATSLPSASSTVIFTNDFASGNPNINGNRTVNQVQIQSSSDFSIVGSGTLTIGSGGVIRNAASTGTQKLSVNIQNNSSVWSVSGAGRLVVDRPVSGTVFTKTGTGELAFEGPANSWGGIMFVQQGALSLNKTPGTSPNFGSAIPGNLTISTGAQVLVQQPHQISNLSAVTLHGTLDISADEGISRLIAEGGLVSGSGKLSLHNQTQAISGKSATISCPIDLNPDNQTATTVFSTDSGHTLTINSALQDGTSVTGSLTKTGQGTLVLSGGNTYSGGTNVAEGILQANNLSGLATGSGNTEIQSGAQLTGTGALSEVTCKSGGTIAPGVSSKAALSMTGLVLESGAVLSIEIGSGSSDRIDTQNATQQGALVINIIRQGVLSVGEVITLINAGAGSYDPAQITVNAGDIKGSFVIDGGALKFVITEAPVYVNTLAVGSGDGSSWQNAYTSLTSAIDSVSSTGVIFVAEGAYIPSDSDRNVSFALKSGVRIYGGFPSVGSPPPSERNPLLHPTILSGGDFSYNVVTAVSVNAGCVLDGFIITGGNADQSGGYGRGGGIYISGNPVIANCIIRNNSAVYGGGVHASGSPTFINCVVVNNKADKGDGFGGGFSISGVGSKLYNCTIAANDAAYGGGLYAADTFTTGAVQIRNSIVWLNTAYSTMTYGGLSYLFGVQNSSHDASLGGTGNNSLYPLFLSPDTGNFDLSANSPSINVGSNAALPADLSDCDLDGDTAEPIPFDIAFRARVVGVNVDQGAYEAPSTATTPSVPSINQVIVVNSGQVNLGWTAVNGQGVTGYNIHRSTVFNFAASPQNRIVSGLNATSYSDLTVVNGLTYYYRVTSQTATGQSVQSNMATASVPASNEIIFVNESSPTAFGNGTSWPLAYRNLQDAHVRATSGDQIWVAGGEYRPTVDVPGKLPNRFQSFELRNGVVLLGGFPGIAGQENNSAVRNPSLFPTILTGNIGSPSSLDDSYTVVRSSSSGSATILDGFTITSGRATGPFNIDQSNGGGLKLTNSSMTIRNCIFESNYSNAGSGLYVLGGAPVFQNCIVRNNHTVNSNTAGGGIWASGTLAQFHGCLITGNSATSSGAGIYYESSNGNPQFINCTVAENSAGGYGGGIYGGSSGKAVLANSIVWGNTTGYLGPQIYLSSGVTITARNSIIQDGFSGTNISTANPQFIAGSYRIPFGSAAVNAGELLDLPATLTQDLDGAPRTIGNAVDLGAYEAYLPQPISSAKQQPDGTSGMTLADKVVTVVGPDYLYVQDPDRSSGLKVKMPAAIATPGDRLNAFGTIKTDSSEERYFEAASLYVLQSGPPVEPLKMVTRDIGGQAVTSITPTGGQEGPAGGSGLNNVGLLVRVAGKITAINAAQGWITVSDGSRNSAGVLIRDMDGNPGVRVYLKDSSIIPSLAIGADFVAEGASALRKTNQRYSVIDCLNN